MITLERREAGIVEPARNLPIDSEVDVLVVGGGMAGVGAAMAASRAGCKTLLIERESMLGGLATAGLVNIPLDFVCGIGAEMCVELEKVNGLWHRNSDPEKHKLVLDRMVLGSGCNVLFHTQAVEAIVKDGVACGAVIENKSGRRAILAQRVIDCSGDADYACFAGCDYHVGRPGDGISQGCSLEFRLGGVAWDGYVESDVKRQDPKWIELIKQGLRDGDMPYEIDNHLNWMTHVPGRPEHAGQDEVSICFAHSRQAKPLDARDLTRMYIEGREQADILWTFIRKRVPGFEACWLIDTAPLLGVRDSRRIVGEYTMTGEDLARWRHFDDVIAISGHGYDIHGPDGPGNIKWIEMKIRGETRYVIATPAGMGTSRPPPTGMDSLCDSEGRQGKEMVFPAPAYYDIPYRSLVPLKVENLLVAGRCLSATFEAQSGCRLVLLCLNMGQAAGTATALSLREAIPPRRIDRLSLQRKLIVDGMNLGQKYREIPGVPTVG